MRKIFRTPSPVRMLMAIRLLQLTTAIVIVVTLMALLAYIFEGSITGGQFRRFGDAVWWAIVTVITGGSSGLALRTAAGQIVGLVTIMSGVVLISLFTATFSSVFIARKLKESQGLQNITFTGHLLICGWNVHIEELLSLFNKQGKRQTTQQIVLVNDAPPDRNESLISAFHNLDVRFVRGDHTHEAVLQRANCAEASAALILPDSLAGNGAMNDDKTLPCLLTVKSLNPETRTYCYIVNREIQRHIKRAGADDVVVSDQHVGFFLANQILNPGAPQVAMEMMDCDRGNDIQTIPIGPEFIGKTFGELFVHLKRHLNYTVLGVVTEQRAMSLNDILLHDTSAIDAFIERKFKEAGINVDERSGARITVNPPFGYVLQKGDEAVVLGTIE